MPKSVHELHRAQFHGSAVAAFGVLNELEGHARAAALFRFPYFPETAHATNTAQAVTGMEVRGEAKTGHQGSGRHGSAISRRVVNESIACEMAYDKSNVCGGRQFASAASAP